MMHRFSFTVQPIFLVLCLFSCTQVLADARLDWLSQFKVEAKRNDISEQTIVKTIEHAEYLPRVIELDRAQPEFIATFMSYLAGRVTSGRVDAGRERLQAHGKLLAQVEAEYGVPKNIIVAFWGLETNYGRNTGDHALPATLFTLAFEGRRDKFFRGQLMDLMKIVDAGHKRVDSMYGSWAGAMGQMQFMPSTFLAHGVDADMDGSIDIWRSLPDAFSSAANYLSSVGWESGEPVAMEVKLPQHFKYQQAQLGIRKSTKKWKALGITRVDGSPLPVLDNTAILLPQGWQGPAFLVASNFDVVMDWNRSINYALSVSHLSIQLLTDKPIVNGLDLDNKAMPLDQVKAIQTKLNALGFDSGTPDGFPGAKTRGAIRQYQAKHGLPQDGYAGHTLYQAIIVKPALN